MDKLNFILSKLFLLLEFIFTFIIDFISAALEDDEHFIHEEFSDDSRSIYMQSEDLNE